MAGKRKFPDDVARQAWGHVVEMEAAIRRSKDGSPEERDAMAAWASNATAAMLAEYFDGGRGYER